MSKPHSPQEKAALVLAFLSGKVTQSCCETGFVGDVCRLVLGELNSKKATAVGGAPERA